MRCNILLHSISFFHGDLLMQSILNKVMKAGLYVEDPIQGESSQYMCRSLSIALKKRVINISEYVQASTEIDTYIGYESFLSDHLDNLGLPNDFSNRFNIYANWGKKPVCSDGSVG